MKPVNAENVRARISQIESAIETMPGGFSLGINHEFELACLRELLSCLESEPVAWTDAEELRDAKGSGSGYLFGIRGAANKFADPRRQMMLYTSPQPALVVQCPFPCGWDNLNKLAIQDAALVARGLVEGEPTTEAHRQAAIANSNRLLKVISACRAAMLSHSLDAGENDSPVIGIDHAAEPDRTVEVRYSAPPGWALVPKEPTHAMLMAWLSEVANWRGHEAGYKAMLAAAPQEVTCG